MDNNINCAQFDAYIKKTCKNILINYKKSEKRFEKHNQSFVPLFDNDSDLIYEDFGFVQTEMNTITVYGHTIHISDHNLANSIKKLPKRNKETLILHVVVNMPLRDIAMMFGVSERMVRKYKKYAIEQIRKEVSPNEQN